MPFRKIKHVKLSGPTIIGKIDDTLTFPTLQFYLFTLARLLELDYSPPTPPPKKRKKKQRCFVIHEPLATDRRHWVNGLKFCVIFLTVDTAVYPGIWIVLWSWYLRLPSFWRDVGRQNKPRRSEIWVPGLRARHSESGSILGSLLRHVCFSAVLDRHSMCHAHNWLLYDGVSRWVAL